MELKIFVFRKIFLFPAGMLDFNFTKSEISTNEQNWGKKSDKFKRTFKYLKTFIYLRLFDGNYFVIPKYNLKNRCSKEIICYVPT